MKKYILTLCAAALTMISCVKSIDETMTTDGQIVAQLQISTSDAATRADDGARYAVEAYYDVNYTTPANVFANGYESRTVSTSSSIDMIISSAKEYYFLIWADNGTSYDVEDLKSVSLIEDEQMSEAWQGTLSIINGDATSYTATLKRAVGKVNFVETEELAAGTLTVTFDSYAGFNVAIGSTAGDETTFTYDYLFSEAVTGLLNEEPVYVFAPVTYSNVIDFNMGDLVVSNIPVQANYITTLSGHFSSEAASGTGSIVVSIAEDWVNEDEENDGVIMINSIEELQRYIKLDNINAKMAPGTYEISKTVAGTYIAESDSYLGDLCIFLFEGNNSTIDFTDVKFELSTEILSGLGTSTTSIHTFQFIGSNSHYLNLTAEYIGDNKPKDSATFLVLDGTNNIIEGFELTTRGSYPYGYGDIFGKGSGPVIAHNKHCGVLVRGENNTMLNSTIYQYAFGHALFCQGSLGATIKGCHTESEVRSTDELLAEAGTGSAADLVNFMTTWGYTVPAGYMYALCEAGYRAYNTGYIYNTGTSRNTSDTYYTDCTAFQVRSAYNILFSDGDRIITNCSSIDCETGYGIGSSSYIYNSRGNSNYGPVIVDDYSSNKNNYIELEILPSEYIYGEHSMLAYIGGSNQTIIFTEPEGTTEQSYHTDLEIMMSGEERGLRFMNSENPSSNNFTCSGMNFTNNTYYRITLAAGATSNTVSTKGAYVDNGSNNKITVIE
ncbi:MAG: hypothetical protein SNG38_08935 [Rikenellaceae bacterium]